MISPPLIVRKNTFAVGQLIQQILDLRGRHLPMIFMIQIAMHASLVAPVGQIQLHAQWDSQLQRLGAHFCHQLAHRVPLAALAACATGFSETIKIPCSASSPPTLGILQTCLLRHLKLFAHFLRHNFFERVRAVRRFQIAVATSFRVNNVESIADMIIISSPIMRAAIFGLRATYCSVRSSDHLPHPRIRHKSQPLHGHSANEIARRLKNKIHQFAVLCKK